ncbi:MAG: hypothetical protein RQ728_09945 [Brevefilum sp.]|nr:hypothetical protein [Brevefilum sp.]MDW7755703.1 hypothetical protein [Brevefilum sp.]
MTGLTKEVIIVWENREGPVVFTAIDEQGTPNSIHLIVQGMGHL